MANKTITQLDAAQSLNDNMVIAVQDTNATYKTTLADVKAYCGASIGIPREVKNGVYQMPTDNFTFSLPSDATDVGNHCLSNAFNGCTGLTNLDLSSLTTVSGIQGLNSAFSDCTGLTNLDLSSLSTVSGVAGLSGAFRGCTSLTSVDLSSLTTVSGDRCLQSAFQGCTSLTTIDLSSLTTVSGDRCLISAFNGCTGLTDVYFRALTTTSFGSTYDNQFFSMMNNTGSTVTHTLHFPSNMQSTISSLYDYPLFGGTDGYVVCVFDLPSTGEEENDSPF